MLPVSRLRIDPNKILYLATIIEHGSLKSAAKALGLSQPALSTSMSRLENELGMRVLERGPFGVLPTPTGEVLYCHARLIRDEIGLAARALINAQGGTPGIIRIGTLPSLASSILPIALTRWRQMFRERELQIVEVPQIDLLTGLLRREFDFVFGFTECYDLENGLRQRVLFRDKLFVIARVGHPLASGRDLKWELLVTYPWVCPTAKRSHVILDAALKAAKIPPPEHMTVRGSVTLLKSLVVNSDHLAVLPAHAVREELQAGRMTCLDVVDPALDRNIAVFSREGYVFDNPSRELIFQVGSVGQEFCKPQRCAVAVEKVLAV
ncbi:LysR family transcriptional regulator [Mesorhizobium sp. STM 4661]|uniref:LysR family transcriptional regulator n=1 Tax=Mesorhizobium sp. STM 4661 TaxID=1297570 RepID=UPI0002BE0A45|nr:LysR family transcriptional regulator [Mesorhizobium sp. STM 4661]CCV16536.1 putative LysR family transcriptional regulator [Mesorhizobium sp. STM 4661]